MSPISLLQSANVTQKKGKNQLKYESTDHQREAVARRLCRINNTSPAIINKEAISSA